MSLGDRETCPREELAWKDWWGFDQIAWFANQPEESRNHFLEYTYKWTEINNPNAYFELPFRRMLGDGAVTVTRADNGEKDRQAFYQMNTRERRMPDGIWSGRTGKKTVGERS